MEQKKVNFFKRVKNAITNFDEYKTFSEEKVSVAIKYLLKVVIIFATILSIALAIRIVNEANRIIQIFNDECPEFRLENNSLIIEGEDKQFIKGDEISLFGIIIDSENENLEDIEQAKNYQRVIALLKDKVILKDSGNTETNIKYEQLAQNYNINGINKQSILEYLSNTNMVKIYAIVIIIFIICLFIIYMMQILLDVLLLSIVGVLLNKIMDTHLKYKSVFNMSIYALTFSILLYLIYMIVNLFTGFEIKYFEMAYNAIAYIYIITAMLMIKSDLTKGQVELTKIIREQRKIIGDSETEEEPKRDKDEDKSKKDNKDENKEDEKKEGEAPEGSNA